MSFAKAEESLLALLFRVDVTISELSTFTLLQIKFPLAQAAPEAATLAIVNLPGFPEDVHPVVSQILKQEAI